MPQAKAQKIPAAPLAVTLAPRHAPGCGSTCGAAGSDGLNSPAAGQLADNVFNHNFAVHMESDVPLCDGRMLIYHAVLGAVNECTVPLAIPGPSKAPIDVEVVLSK